MAQRTWRTGLQRENLFARRILMFFLLIASYPRLLLEVFIRRNFGERYFSLASAICVLILLSLFPALADSPSDLLGLIVSQGDFTGSEEPHSFWGQYATWYLFLAAFAVFSYKRWQEVKSLPSVFDFERYSLDSGEVHPFFFTLPVYGKREQIRTIEIFYEPAVFFFAGLLMRFIGQPVGGLLLISSICYALGYKAAYWLGDNEIMDRIDDIIRFKQLKNIIIHKARPSETQGLQFRGRLPNNPDKAEMLADTIIRSEYREVATVV